MDGMRDTPASLRYLQSSRVAVLLGDVLPQQRLGQPHLAAERTGVGLRLLRAVTLAIVE